MYKETCIIMVIWIILIVALEVLTYFFGMLPGQFSAAITNFDMDLFVSTLWKTALYAIARSLLTCGDHFLGGVFQYKAREILSRTLQKSLVRSSQLYEIIYGHSKIDNPDQRITQDVDKCTDYIVQILQKTFIAPFLIVYYSWRVGDVMGYIGPLLIFSYMILSSAIVRFSMTPIIPLVFLKERLEGNFRFIFISS